MATTMMEKRRAAFFDRDEVLNVNSGFVFRREQFVWRPTAVESVRRLNARGVLVFVVTNQSGVARGLYAEAHVTEVHAHMQAELAREGAHIDAFRYCPHHPEAEVAGYRLACACRKPGSGMILDLLAAYSLEAEHCRLFGDRDTDLEAARGAGVPSTLVTDETPLIDIVRSAFPSIG
jgi:D-glycero-D-manno-heptose 1,7-bisphosphate phosphatase